MGLAVAIARDARRLLVRGLAAAVCGCAAFNRRSETPAPLRPPLRDSLLAVDAGRRGSDGRWRIVASSDVGGPPLPGEVPPPAQELAPALSLTRGRRADAVRQVREADSAFAIAADLQGTGVAFSSFVAPQGVVFSN